MNSKTAAAWPTGGEDNAAPVIFTGGAAQLRRRTSHTERSNAGQAAKVFLTQTLPKGRQISRGNSTLGKQTIIKGIKAHKHWIDQTITTHLAC